MEVHVYDCMQVRQCSPLDPHCPRMGALVYRVCICHVSVLSGDPHYQYGSEYMPIPCYVRALLGDPHC